MAAHPALVSPSQYLTEEAKATLKSEYIDGHIYAMSGASRNHVEITAQLGFLLGSALEGSPCRRLDQDTKVWIAKARCYFYPDATVSCPPNFIDDANGVIDNPTVVFEVLSPSTAVLDEGAKFASFRQLDSLRNYVLIDSRRRNVKVFSLESGEWVAREYRSQDEAAIVPSISVSLSLGGLYQFAEFESSRFDPRLARD